jgi:sugar O-acyltransferase (sialic acid O-acetyltransferase NeuD family)
MQDIVIVGAGDFGREVIQYVKDTWLDREGYRLKGFLDDRSVDLRAFGLELDIIGSPRNYTIQEEDRFLVAIGDPPIHRLLTEQIAQRGGRFLTLLHPRAYVALTAFIGEGTIVAPFAFVGPHARVASHVVLNIYASVGHDARVEAHTIFAPYATVNGHVVVESEVLLGTHATVTARKHISHAAKISAGSVVYQDVPARALALGNPAKARILYPE